MPRPSLLYVLFVALLCLLSIVHAAEDVQFRLDIGTNNFLPNPPPHQGKGVSERDRFIARMNAARNPSKQPSWSDDYKVICTSTNAIDAEIFPFDPASPHPGWAWAFEELDKCQSGPYPGNFSPDEEGFRMIRMDVAQMPKPVREWLQNHQSRELCVVDGVAFFAPGSLLGHLPLFASTGDECGGAFNSLEKYGKDVHGERIGGGLLAKSEVGSTLRVQVKADLMRRKQIQASEGRDEL